jgi:hypothetical protein
MEKYDELYNKLANCYKKIHLTEYKRLAEEDRDAICQREKADFKNYVNSDSMNFQELVKERLAQMESKIIF